MSDTRDHYALARYHVAFPAPLVECEGCGERIARDTAHHVPRVGYLCDWCADAETAAEEIEEELT